MEEEHADKVMSALVHPAKVHQRVDAGGKGSVEPTSTLPDELRCTLRHIRLSLGCLDVGQVPLGTSLGNQLEAENTVLGQEHVLLEDVHTFDTLLPQNLGEGVITVEVLVERSSHDGPEAVRRERAGKHADVSKRTLQGLVEDVTDLVLEILGCHQRIQQVLPSFAQHGVDLSAGTAKVLVVVESLPESQQRLGTGLGASVEQDANLRVQDPAERGEKPSVRIDLLAILLLQAKHHLHRRQGAGTIVVWPNELLVRSHRKLSRILELCARQNRSGQN